jgi:iron complex outermembrane receptor protein
MIDTVISADDASAMRNRGQLPAGEPAINSPFLTGKQAAGLALMLTLCHAVPGQSAEQDKAKLFQFDIPAGNMASALTAFSEAADMQLSYPSVLVRDVKSEAVSGRYTADQALQKLLAGSDLTYRHTGNDVIALAAKESDSPRQSLPTAATTLTAVTVVGKTEADEDPMAYNVPNATTATKMDIPIMDTPVNIQVVPKAIMDDQQDIKIEDALTKNVSGVQRAYAFGDLYEEFTIRGFSTKHSIYRNGLRRYTNFFDPANIEQIEVVKGPAAVLYGQIQPGGMVNIVTKKAWDKPYYSLQQQFGNYDQYRTTAEATGPIDENGTLKYRLDLAYQDLGSFKRFVNDERVFIAPTLRWTPNDRFEANFELEYKFEDRVNDFGIPAIGNRPAPVPLNTFLGDGSKGPKMNSVVVAFDWAFKLNDDWQIKNRFLHEDWDIDYFDAQPNFMINDRELARFAVTGQAFHETYATNLDLLGHFDLFGAKHNVLVGGDYSRRTREAGDNRFSCCNDSTTVPPIDIFNPRYGLIDHAVLDASPFDYAIKQKEEWFGIYFQDHITLWEKLHILGGGRYDWATFGQGSDPVTGSLAKATALYTDQENQKFSPRVGIVYQPVDWLSLYGNWTESLGSANTGTAFGNQQFKPEIGEQFEGGFKTEFFDQRLSSTVAYYYLTKENLKVPDPEHRGFQIEAGTARSQGIEVDVKGQVTEQFDLVATYAFTDARMIENGGNANGVLGKRLANVPEHQASLWGTYQFTPQFRAGVGGVVVGEREGNAQNTYQLPGYVRMDMMAAYVQPIGKTRLTTQLNINNVLDKEYYGGSDGFNQVITGNPLSVMGSLRLEY